MRKAIREAERRFLPEGGRSCYDFDRSLGRGCPRDRRGAADGGQLVLGRAQGRGGGPVRPAAAGKTAAEAAEALYGLAGALIAEDEAVNRRIGAHGAALLRELADKLGTERETPRGPPVAVAAMLLRALVAPARRQGLNILTHCNAGSLATAFLRHGARRRLCGCARRAYQPRLSPTRRGPVNQGARLHGVGVGARWGAGDAAVRRYGGVAYGRGEGGCRDRRGRPHRRQRGCGQQGGHAWGWRSWLVISKFRFMWLRREAPSIA